MGGKLYVTKYENDVNNCLFFPLFGFYNWSDVLLCLDYAWVYFFISSAEQNKTLCTQKSVCGHIPPPTALPFINCFFIAPRNNSLS